MRQLELFETKEEEYYSAETYSGIYAMHKYWSKKPANIIRDLIKKYSLEGDIVLDPFCGSGVSIIESLTLNRKAIGIDINPSAIFITKQMLNRVNPNSLLEYFNIIKDNIKPQIDRLYEIERDGKIITASHFIWEDDKLSEIWYFNKRKKNILKPLKEDELSATKIKLNDIPYFYPKNSFFKNSRINTKEGQKVFDLFTPRNLYALSMLYNEIEKIDDSDIRDIFKFIFTSSIGQSSKMVFILNRKKRDSNGNFIERKEVGSWVIGYWTPKNFFEINVWRNFDIRFKKIFKAKSNQFCLDLKIDKTDNIQDIIYGNFNFCLLNEPSQIALKNFPDNSIDYIITDPPHGDRVPYLELGILWNSWLKQEPDFENEIVISNAKERKKDIKNYNLLINRVFFEIYRTLKPNRYFSLIFNSLDDEVWLNLILELFKIGFVLYNIEILGYSANSVVQDNRKKGLKTDFILTFMKSNKKMDINLNILTLENNRDYLEKSVEKIINRESNKEIYNLINKSFKFFLKRNEFFKLSEILEIINRKV